MFYLVEKKKETVMHDTSVLLFKINDTKVNEKINCRNA